MSPELLASLRAGLAALPRPVRTGVLRSLQAFGNQMAKVATVTSRLGFDPDQLPTAKQSSIFINTIPKSGSMFLETVLRAISGRPRLRVGTGYFPNDTILVERIRLFARGGFIAQQHADASPNNIALLEKYVGRWIVHLRDPRSVILSWTHHLDKLAADGQADLWDFSGPIPDQAYVQRTFAGRLDWQVDNFLPAVVAWMEAWVRYADARPNRVLLTTFEEMTADEQAFLRRFAAFFELDAPQILETAAYKTRATHYRKGETDEWRRAFTSEQQQRALSAIPDDLAGRFRWPRV